MFIFVKHFSIGYHFVVWHAAVYLKYERIVRTAQILDYYFFYENVCVCVC